MGFASIRTLWLVLLLGAVHLSVPLQSISSLQSPSPGTKLLFADALSPDGSMGRMKLGTMPGSMSPITLSEVSEPDLNDIHSLTPLGEDYRYFDSPHMGVQDPSEWVPPEEWNLPPPAASSMPFQRVAVKGGVRINMEMGIAGFESHSLDSTPLSPATPYESRALLYSTPYGGLPCNEWGGRRPICNICQMKDAVQGSVKWEGKRCTWDMLACRICAPAAAAKQTASMIQLRGRCRDCPRWATFAPPEYPQHTSLHCKNHKWEGEISSAKRRMKPGTMSAERGKLEFDWNSLSLYRDQRAFNMDEDISACDSSTASCVVSPYATAHREPLQKTPDPSHPSSGAPASYNTRCNTRCNTRRAAGIETGHHSSHSIAPSLNDQIWKVEAESTPPWVPGSAAAASRGDRAVVVMARCRGSGCRASAVFGSTSDGIASSCKKHKSDGEVRLVAHRKHGLCSSSDGCMKRASFGDAEEGIALFCASHKHSWHINVRAIRCQVLHCDRHSAYGPPASPKTQSKPLLCSKHRGRGHVDLRHARRASPCASLPRRTSPSSRAVTPSDTGSGTRSPLCS
jgi:hypothetical protein